MSELVADLRTSVGSIELPNPVLTAAGTAGHGAELGAYVDLSTLGAVVVKSLWPDPWPGNPAPRVHPTMGGMLNSVGLQGPGIPAWKRHDLPKLRDAGARVVVSIWGRSVDEYRRGAELLADCPDDVVAVEVNLSCPNLDPSKPMFAHSTDLTAEAVTATEACGRPRWAKLSPNVANLAAIAGAARDAGAEAVTLVNTLLGMVIDPVRRRPVLGGGGGGLSGPAIHPVAVRAVWEVHKVHPTLPIVGVGGVVDGPTAVELLLAGARAVQVGTATFADPRAPAQVLQDLGLWCSGHGVARVTDLIGGAHV